MHLGEQWDRRDWVALLRELSWNEGGATRYGWIDQLRGRSSLCPDHSSYVFPIALVVVFALLYKLSELIGLCQ